LSSLKDIFELEYTVWLKSPTEGLVFNLLRDSDFLPILELLLVESWEEFYLRTPAFCFAIFWYSR